MIVSGEERWVCSHCKQARRREDYGPRPDASAGIRPCCRACDSERQRQRRARLRASWAEMPGDTIEERIRAARAAKAAERGAYP